MIPKECKRLTEVDFPIAKVSRHAAKEKSVWLGHPSTLHLWWARRPLAACRAMLLGILLPDPCDQHCPDDFRMNARKLPGKLGAHPRSVNKPTAQKSIFSSVIVPACPLRSGTCGSACVGCSTTAHENSRSLRPSPLRVARPLRFLGCRAGSSRPGPHRTTYAQV
jgi:hypothetical protein